MNYVIIRHDVVTQYMQMQVVASYLTSGNL